MQYFLQCWETRSSPSHAAILQFSYARCTGAFFICTDETLADDPYKYISFRYKYVVIIYLAQDGGWPL